MSQGYRIRFEKATDARVPQSELLYKLYTSLEPNIDTLDGIDRFGTLRASAHDVSSFVFADPPTLGTYYHTVTVEDKAGNRSIYTMGSRQIIEPIETELTILDEPFFIQSGNTRQISFFWEPGPFTNTILNWSSSDESIATVDSNGVVTGVSEGEVTVTVTSDADPSFTDSVLFGVDTFDFAQDSETRSFTTIQE
jgi:hypothetical protein